MAKLKSLGPREDHFLRLLLHIDHTPLLPLLSHIQETYPTNTHPSLPIRLRTSSTTIRLMKLPSEHLSLYSPMFEGLASTIPRFDFVFQGFRRINKANGTDKINLRGQAEGKGLKRVQQEIRERFIRLDGNGNRLLWGKRLPTNGIKFQPVMMALTGLEKESVEAVRTGLMEEKWFGEGIRCRALGLALCAKWPERFPKWKEDLYWGFGDDEDLEGQNERSFGERERGRGRGRRDV